MDICEMPRGYVVTEICKKFPAGSFLGETAGNG